MHKFWIISAERPEFHGKTANSTAQFKILRETVVHINLYT